MPLLVTALGGFTPASANINYWQEKQFSSQLVKLLPQRQIQWLETSPKTLALVIPSHATHPQGVAIILPAPGEHPDQMPIIGNLRQQLPGRGWSSLSVQMPVIDKSNPSELVQLYDAARPRLDAAINLILQQNPASRIILIAHGFSGSVAIQYLRDHPQLFAGNGSAAVKGLVLISLPGQEASGDWLDSTEGLQSLTLPILDIFAEYDRQEVLDSAPERLKSSHIAGRSNPKASSPTTPKVRELAKNKTGNPLYRQYKINAAISGFPRQHPFLLKAIRSWLEENPH